MAKKIYSQIRKGAVFHDEWKNAFTSGKFMQKNGRSRGVSSARDNRSTNILTNDESESDEIGCSSCSTISSSESLDYGSDSTSFKIRKHHKQRRRERTSIESRSPTSKVQEAGFNPCQDPCTDAAAVATVVSTSDDAANTSNAPILAHAAWAATQSEVEAADVLLSMVRPGVHLKRYAFRSSNTAESIITIGTAPMSGAEGGVGKKERRILRGPKSERHKLPHIVMVLFCSRLSL
jgi:hypothetical protein